MPKICSECRYYVSHTTVGLRLLGINSGGECRYAPPVSQHTPFTPGIFPIVQAGDWCGRFTQRVNLPVSACAQNPG